MQGRKTKEELGIERELWVWQEKGRKKGEGMMVDGWMCLQTPSTQTNKDYTMPQAPKPHAAAHQHTFPPEVTHTHTSTSPRNAPLQHPPKKNLSPPSNLQGRGKPKTYSWFLYHPSPSLVGLFLGSSQPFLPSLSWSALLHPFSSLSFSPRSGLVLGLGWFGRGWRGWGRR